MSQKRQAATTHVLYLPGFGDRYNTARAWLLGRWRYPGVTVELLPMNWGSDESFDDKLARIIRAIDNAQGERVVLLGESAGGSMAVHAYAERPSQVAGVLTICGKNTNPTNVKSYYYAKYPAFRGSMDRLDDSLARLDIAARRRFVSIHPLYDPVVTVADTRVPGSREVVLPAVGHLSVIVLALTVWSRRLVGLARSL